MKQKVKNLLVVVVVLCSVFIAGFTSTNHVVANAAPSSASQTLEQMQNSSGGVLGNDVKKKVLNLSVDVQELIMAGVIAILTCTTIITATKFSGAGDDAQAKGKLKNKIIYQLIGIGFAASVLGLIKFGLVNLNLF
ncbi:MAG: hypothetical protein ACLS2V_12940 [Clostridium paraputrificum]|uniref:hypothetical protein n=1 Tax=Clostridium sp. TaxID=1506 RepID=UPI0025BD802D|nr:hypothetical protein [Clostridium sp.]MBS5926225.1 hypothetical protein [Clostridium sp.]